MKQLDLLTIFVQYAIVTSPGSKIGMKKQIMCSSSNLSI